MLEIAMALANFAPQIVTLLGGKKAGDVAAAVVNVAKEVTGVDDAAGAVSAIQQNPDLAFKFQELIANREMSLANLDADLQKAYLADTDSARKMQTAALQQDDIFSKRFVYYFAAAWSAFAMLYSATILFVDIPTANVRFVDTFQGFLLGTAIASIFNFFLGTTYRNQKKDDTISALATR